MISPDDSFINLVDHSGIAISVCLCEAVVNQEGKKIFTTPKKIRIGRPNIIDIGRPASNLCLNVLSRSRVFSQYSINCLSFSLIMLQNYGITATSLP